MADEQFYTILTNIGKAKVANAALLNNNVTLKTLKVGDSNGNYYNPTEEQTVLKNTVYSCDVGSVQVDKDNPNWIIVETVIPGSVGGFTIREIGLFDVDGDLIAIGKYPETYKPKLENGAGKDVCIRTIFEVSNTESVNLSINPSVIIATKEDINNLQKQITDNANSKLNYDLINGSLRIAQRFNASDATTFTNPVNKYIMDRFLCNGTGTVVPIESGGCTVTGTINFKYWMEKTDFDLLPSKFNITYSVDGVETILEVIKADCTVDADGNGLIFNQDITDSVLNYVHYGKRPFMPRFYGEELALCKRYYEASAWDVIIPGMKGALGKYEAEYRFDVEKRITPTLIYGNCGNSESNKFALFTLNIGGDLQEVIGSTIETKKVRFMINSSDSNVNGTPCTMTGYIKADAEIY